MDGFARGQDFEVTNIEKNDEAYFSWIKAPSPNEAEWVKSCITAFSNELMDASLANKEKMVENDKARKNVVVYIAKTLTEPSPLLQLKKVIKHIWEIKL